MSLLKVVNALKKIAPLELADLTFDNVGLLIDSPVTKASGELFKVLMTIDLTEAVLEEAINMKASLIIAYHPPIFTAIKRLSMQESKHRIVLNAVYNGIAVYSPHTALDACNGGINDWLIDGIVKDGGSWPIIPSTVSNNVGMGRIKSTSQPLSEIIRSVKSHLGISNLRISMTSNHNLESIVNSIAVCAGSGGSILKGGLADVLITGEMSHHQVLAANDLNSTVILCEHTNTERGYLSSKLKPVLDEMFKDELFEFKVSSSDKEPCMVI